MPLRRAIQLAALAWLALPATALAQLKGTPVVARGFVVENAVPGSHIEAPAGVLFTPDGRLLVADVPGRIWVIDHGVQLPAPMWAHETEVEINGDCGLLGMALDPDFGINRYIYLLYAVDPDSNGVDDDSLHFGRLTRYQVSETNPNLIDESTRTVLLGHSWADGIPVASGTHSVGSLRFAADGTLLVSQGEGARYDMVDPGGITPGLFKPGMAPATWDRGAFRALDLDCPGGKILRIDPRTGGGLPSNPFWDGESSSVRSKIWAYGFRNPFRFCIRPGTGAANAAAGNPGALYVGDVGWNTWEELDVATSGGLDFGWPCEEGPRANPGYDALNPAFGGCGALGAPVAPTMAFSHIWPDSSSPRGCKANAIVSGLFYDATQFPPPWRGRLIYSDFFRGWIRAASFDAAQNLVACDSLAGGMNGPVDFAIEPSTGWLYVACIGDDTIRRIRWAPAAGVETPADALALSAPWPDPASGTTRFTLTLSSPARVSLEIYDPAGRRVWSAPPRDYAAGVATLAWDGRNAAGAAMPAGVYLARVEAGGVAETRRLVRLSAEQ